MGKVRELCTVAPTWRPGGEPEKPTPKPDVEELAAEPAPANPSRVLHTLPPADGSWAPPAGWESPVRVRTSHAYGPEAIVELSLSRRPIEGAGCQTLQAMEQRIREALREAMRPSEARRRRNALADQLAAAEHAARVAGAKADKARSDKALAELEARPGCGKTIQRLDAQAAEAEGDRGAAEIEAGAVRPLLKAANEKAEAELRVAFVQVYATALADFAAAHAKAKGVVLGAAMAALTEQLNTLLELDAAMEAIRPADSALMGYLSHASERFEGDEEQDAGPAADGAHKQAEQGADASGAAQEDAEKRADAPA